MKKHTQSYFLFILLFFLPFINLRAQQVIGNLYGMTSAGGLNNGGVIFYYDSINRKDSVIYNFPTNALPQGSLILASDGNFYGMAAQVGDGILFKCTSSGSFTTLINFNDTNGRDPQGSLIQATDGNLYGMTSAGGSGWGTIFKYNISTGVLNTLVKFNSTNGAGPVGSLIQATDGNLYGMTQNGGSGNAGVIFKCTTSGVMTTIVNFPSGGPFGNLIQATDGNLYGMTYGGGTSLDGTLFKCTTSGTLTTLVTFTGIPNGRFPYGSLIQATDGNLYGVTSGGGSTDYGTIFKCSTSGTFKMLFNFNGTNGEHPYGSLIQASDGNLYGMTNHGGASNSGNIFKCSTSGVFDTVISFNYTKGAYPLYGNLLEVKNNISTAINKIPELKYNAYAFPNPGNGAFTIQSTYLELNSMIEVYNILGLKIFNSKLSSTTTQIDLSNNPTGIYLYRVLNEAGELISTGKLVIQK